MKLKSFILAICAPLLFCVKGKAQEITFRTEYIGNSSYYYLPSGDKPKERIGNSKGSAMIYQLGANVPLSMKIDAKKRPTVWGLGFGANYVDLNNKNFTDDMVSEIMNLSVAAYHLRPLNDKWSLRASLGIVALMPNSDLSEMRFRHILGSGGAIFIRHLKPNLSIGVGAAINSTLGYPMIFPAVYVKWTNEGKIDLKIELVDGLEIAAGYKFNDQFKLSYAIEMNGQAALLKKDGEDMIFSHQYIVTGFRPEMTFGKSGLSVTGMFGLNLYRPSSYIKRTLKGLFASDNDYYFSVSPYASVGLKYKF